MCIENDLISLTSEQKKDLENELIIAVYHQLYHNGAISLDKLTMLKRLHWRDEHK